MYINHAYQYYVIKFMDAIIQAVKNVGVENIDVVSIYYVLKL